MSRNILEKYFNIQPERSVQIGRYTRFVSDGLMYTIVPVTHVEQEVLIELYEMSEHMAKYSDKKVSRFVACREGKFLVTHEDEDYVLLKNQYRSSKRQRNTGRQLARFHQRGKKLQARIVSLNRIGEWKEFWAKRLDQMERVWFNFTQEPPRDPFDQLFFESFSYYMGLCENAIQYVTDTEMDEKQHLSDVGTITHHRFHEDLWMNEQEIRNPFDWVIDHPARDLSEWVRDGYFKGSRAFIPEVGRFFNEYQSISPLSPFSWRLVYARLLFPLHYFNCVEEYYNTSTSSVKLKLEETLKRYLRDTEDYEKFLRYFYNITGAGKVSLPKVEWL